MRNQLLPRRLMQTRMSSPFRALSALENEMEKWFGDGLTGLSQDMPYDFSPSCDIKETKTEFIMKFDIPGIKKEDVKIEVDDNRLTVRGERREEKEEKEEKSYLSETFYGSFTRSFALPTKINESEVDARYQDGVLTVRVPKSKPAKSKEIAIQ